MKKDEKQALSRRDFNTKVTNVVGGVLGVGIALSASSCGSKKIVSTDQNKYDLSVNEEQKVITKAEEIFQTLAEETGVDKKDVELILRKLGIINALGNRINAEKNQLQTRTLNQVNTANIRIAAGVPTI